MKKVTKKNREACPNSYQQCEDMERCSVICRGAHLHPECKQYLACKLDRLSCDGICEPHELRKLCHEKNIMMESLSHALTELNFAYRKTKEEKEALEARIDEIYASLKKAKDDKKGEQNDGQ